MSQEYATLAVPDGASAVSSMTPLGALSRDFSWIDAEEPAAQDSEAARERHIERFGFRVADLHILCPMELVSEVTPVPTIHRIPNPPRWMLGAANLRGNVVPITNPARFLGLMNRAEKSMLVVFGTGEERAGLVVDDMPDIQRFSDHERLHSLPPVPDSLRPQLLGAYEQQGIIWLEVDIAALLDRLNL